MSTTTKSTATIPATSATSGRSESSVHLKSGPNLEMLKRLFEMMGDYQVSELEWEQGDERIRVKTGATLPEPVSTSHTHTTYSAPAPAINGNYKGGSASHSPTENPSGATSQKPASSLSANQKQILSPFVGTFYRSPSPDSEPYAKEGQAIKKGDSLCIVEAMKLMNEIECEHNGIIIKVLVQNGQPVEFGEPLFVIETH